MLMPILRKRLLSSSKPRWRSYSADSPKGTRSPHAQWYADIVPAMIPISLLGSAVYLGLQLAQQKLSHEKYMEEASQYVKELETEVERLRVQAERVDKDEVKPSAQTPIKPTFKASRWWW